MMKKFQTTLLALMSFLLFTASPYASQLHVDDPVVSQNQIKKVTYKPYKKQIKYDMLVSGQPRSITYEIKEQNSDQFLVYIAVDRPGKSSLRLSIGTGKEAKFNDTWDKLSKHIINLNLLRHPVVGLEPLQKEQPKMFKVPIGPIIDILDKLPNFKGCKTKVSCSCSDGKLIEITCKCGQQAQCEELKTIIEKESPGGETSREEKITCTAFCM